VEEIIAEVGEDPEVWLPLFYDRMRLKSNAVPSPKVDFAPNVVYMGKR
jgi:hypothetical protein